MRKLGAKVIQVLREWRGPIKRLRKGLNTIQHHSHMNLMPILNEKIANREAVNAKASCDP
jgi:hypothetical protein